MLKYLFLIFLIIVFVPQVRQFVFYLLVGRQLVNEQKRHQEAQNRKATKPGSTKVDFVPPGAIDSRTKGGEYVDYEEIK